MEPMMQRDAVLENMQPVVWAVTIPFAVLCLASCIIRLYARHMIAKSFGPDDWLMFVGTFIWIGQQYIAWMWTILGGGLHVSQVSADNQFRISVYLFVEEFWYLLLQFIIKTSFLFFYRRTICTSGRMRTTIYIVMGVVVCQTIGTWLFYGLQCIPIQAYFHPELYPDARCVATKLSYYLPSAVNVSVDVVIYVLPIFPLWKLQTSRRRRIELIAIFTAGGGAVLVSLLRFIVLYQLSNTTDTTYVFGSVTIVTSIEFAVAMITNNMPGVAAFYQTWRGKSKSSSTGRGTSTGGTHGQRSYELGHLATIGSKPQRSKADAYAAAKDDDFFPGTDSEEELNPRHHRDSRTLQKIMEGSGEVRVETNVVVSHGPIPSSSSERGSEKRAGEYFKFG